ncbi:hypothetical protein [Clavibacter michiganensis]|uniref:hypothetical protein n=1 Tax=Clavibacter michiganensis TaxID=28447 RepID=UPI0018680090|nr:hypothetical protein [Clavibacter michiganensis]MBE3077541.1 hypothetical protein [Clavibacter michiganensis subsp. michiganensis]MDO4029937.1 hypothetical protein [Clavibacter michiganensis]
MSKDANTSNDHASAQESQVHEFANYSLSATMIFAPVEYKKGDATREPCDLVWVARDMLFLIAMQESKKSQEKQDSHNLTQLRGWLRAWSTLGLKLEGETTLRSYSIGPTEYQTVLISVTDTLEGRASILPLPGAPKNAAEEKVILACSIPAAALSHLATAGGGAADLAALIDQLAKAPEPVSAHVFIQWIDDLRNSAYHRILVKYRIPEALSRKFLDTYPHHVLLSLRHSGWAKDEIVKDKANYGVVSAFNDINWYQTYEICWHLACFAGAIIEVPVGQLGPGGMGQILKMGNYTVYIGVYDAAADGAMEKVMEGYEKAMEQQKDGFPVLLLTMMIMGRASAEPLRSLMFGGEHITGPSNTRQMLERAAARLRPSSTGSTGGL